jgi:cobalt-zinc-cadmium resistance protein CzcA
LQLRTVPGVADVLSFGGDVKQYQVVVDQVALVNYNIPLNSLFEAVQNNNQNTGANFIEHGDQQYVVRGLGLVKDIEDIKNIVLESRAEPRFASATWLGSRSAMSFGRAP